VVAYRGHENKRKGNMRYKYKVKEQGSNKEETMDAMSLKKLIKKLDPKKIFEIDYVNKQGSECKKLITNGSYKIV
tara:strand:- start:121 stop:345 length:225 start_codon:yes stop_codon:yes gene_type:complete